MNYIDIVTMLALIQYLIFSGMVGKARGTYGVKAPAVTGDEGFERIYRVQMNTLELLVPLIPAMYAAAHYWPQLVVALTGAVYLLGRILYWRSYVTNPSARGLGFFLSIFPIFGLILSALVAAVLSSGAA